MFTGNVEAIGTVTAISGIAARKTPGLTIGDAKSVLQDCCVGDRLNVSGVCLRISKLTEDTFEADVSSGVFWRTKLNMLAVGSKVHLERPVSGNSRFSGHFIQGRIDATGSIIQILPQNESQMVTIEPREPRDETVIGLIEEGGFVAVDGVSALVAQHHAGQFTIEVPGYRFERFAFRHTDAADIVNIEVDMHTRIVAKQIEARVNETIASLVDDHLCEKVDDALDDIVTERIIDRIDWRLNELLPKHVADMRRKIEEKLDL